MSLCIYLPAYQAEKTLAGVLARIPAQILARPDLRLLVVDDGSRDGTAALATSLARSLPALELHSFSANQGYGAAVAHGLAWARRSGARAAICLHSDGQYPPEAIPALLERLESGLDLVQGSRHREGTALRGGMPLYKWAAGHALSALERRVLGLDLTDFHSGLLAFGPRALEVLPESGMSTSFDFDLEAIARCRAADLRIGEIGIPTRYADEESHLRSIPYGWACLRVLRRYLREELA